MASTLTDQAYHGLRRKLATGALRAGQRIVNRTVSKELNVSQTPLREAINRLASEGVVEYVPGAGAFVRTVSLQDLLQLYDVRELVEPFAAERAARHATDGELAEMQAICDDWRAIAGRLRDRGGAVGPDDLARWNDNEERFHGLLLAASRNHWLVTVAGNLRMLSVAFAVQRQHPHLLTPRGAAVTWREHVRIVRALRARDGDAAMRAMRQHVRNGRTHVLTALGGGGR
ncbi:MAG TPA: GntR family transcriptional regulator [Humisphaera sp.]